MDRINERIAVALKECEAKLQAPPRPPSGALEPELFVSTQEFCRRWGESLLQILTEEVPSVREARPLLLGSWARGELMPKSDMDLGFVGGEKAIETCVREFQKAGLRVRPRDLSGDSWKEWPRVEQLSLLETRGLAEFETAERAEELKKEILSIPSVKRRPFLKAILEDRKARAASSSAFENVLEPRIKVGLGGLRDLQQLRQVLDLFPELCPDSHAAEVAEYYRWFFNSLRLKLHLLGGNDFLQAALQPDLAQWLGYRSFLDLMKEIQKGLSRSLFYADWTVAWALASKEEREKARAFKWRTPEAMGRDLEKNPDLLVQYQVRRQLDHLITASWRRKEGAWIYRFLRRAFLPEGSEDFLRALFRSRLMDSIDPRLRALVGFNQHDQYHAYTADTHILNLLLEFKRAMKSPRRLGRFARAARACGPGDREILAWSCYYHDLAKGGHGDHEKLAVNFVLEDAKRFGRPASWADEIAWIVRHHLEFSRAAFRENSHDEGTLKKLMALGLNEARVRRLSLFTVLDIRATHPRAWTPWKEKLLFDLTVNLLRPRRLDHLEALQRLEEKFSVRGLPISFVEQVGAQRIERDLKDVEMRVGFQVYPVRGGYWIRYAEPENRPGRLMFILQALFSAGCSVRKALVGSLEHMGIYDWFMVECGLGRSSLGTRLRVLAEGASFNPPPKVRWDHIEWLSLNDRAWSLFLRGRDQRGLLLATVAHLRAAGAHILSAQADTWGRRVEDVIEIRPLKGHDPQAWLKEWLKRFD